MDTNHPSHDTGVPAAPSGTPPARRAHWPTVLLLVAGLAAGSTALVMYGLGDPEPVPKKEAIGAAWDYEAVFHGWPTDRKPDVALVITGQTYGYLQKCGCSDPQKGGLERRYNFIQGLKAHGIEVIPVDLGDVPPQVSEDGKILHAQALLKYQTAMRSMKGMGYRVVGLGKEEFALDIQKVHGEYAFQPGNDEPAIVGANILGFLAGKEFVAKAAGFPNGKGDGTAIHDWALIPTKSNINVGVVAILGDSLIKEVKQIDPNLVFADTARLNSEKAVKNALAEMDKQKVKTGLNVLLYSGPFEAARVAAKAFPQFRVLVCRSEESEPPGTPNMVGDTMVIRVGHKGQNVGVVGVFKDRKGGYELKYQRVALSPEYETPQGKEKENPALHELERYAKLVKERKYLLENRRQAHPLQVTNSKATYAGSEACMKCHDTVVKGDSWAVWANSKHAKAYAALEHIAKKPSLRNFDGECIRCHTVGYDYNTGFVDAIKTPHLKNVGCESCHGPGSHHVANPENKQFALELSPWKVNGKGKMPDVKVLQAMLEEKNPAKKQNMLSKDENAFLLRVDRVCQTCHNQENDPHFKIEKFWPKVAHSMGAVNPPKNNVKEDGPKVVPGKDIGPALTPPTGPDLKLPNR